MDILNSQSITRMETILKEISVFNHIIDQDTKAHLGSVGELTKMPTAFFADSSLRKPILFRSLKAN
jgi:hypothetical protein